ncbi:hypothetical protein ACSBR2_032777 [Camellia fascicularis]
MDPRFTEFSNSTKDFKFDDDSFLPAFDQAENPANMFKFKGDPGDLNSIDHYFFPDNSPDPGFKMIFLST